MVFFTQREKRLWTAAGLCLLLIYLSAYVVRPVATYLRDRNLLRLAVAMVFLIACCLIVVRLVLAKPGWRVLLVAGLVGLAFLLLFSKLPMMPEERIHFLEYGLIGVLIYFALLERRTGRAVLPSGHRDRLIGPPPVFLAVVLTGLAGWIDEGIQAILPNRYYDLRDVAFNAAAAALAVISVKIIGWPRLGE